MKLRFFLLMCICTAAICSGNTRAIDFKQMPEKELLKTDFQELFGYEYMLINNRLIIE